MSDKKQTFIDPKTGEEIESTRFSKISPRLFMALFAVSSLIICKNTLGLVASILGLIGLLPGILGYGTMKSVRVFVYDRWIHDTIARMQYFRQQRLLQRKLVEEEWKDVPATALSLADPSKSPQPTSMSLSQANRPEEAKPRLTVGVDQQSTDQEESASV